MKQKVIIDTSWFENPRSNSEPEHRDHYEFADIPEYI